VHVSTSCDDGTWVVELRPPGAATGPVNDARAGERIDLPGGGQLVLLQRHLGGHRLWRASSELCLTGVLARHGRPITYSYVQGRWPLASYQTVFGVEPGSAEMASAARPFSAQVVTDLATRGITVAPVLLHTGVSSPEVGEPPQPERFAVSASTAALVRHTRDQGGRVVAVGTTVTRALETAADARGQVWAGHGWTDLVLGRTRPARVVDGLVTGWHPPGASHQQLLEAVAGPHLVHTAYAAAAGYRWHEFGDSCLLLP
jgi:S-adenosylmethionine:tRNA ribosyltransferase-isomerase